MTLLELLCVMAILVILLSVAYPSIESMSEDIRQTAAADQVRTIFAEARAHAIDDGLPYRVSVKPGQSDFRVAPDLVEMWEGGGSTPSEGGGAEYVNQGQLTDGVIFQVPSGGGDSGTGWVTVTTFRPDATCGNDGVVEVHYRDCRPIRFFVRALTGHVRVWTLSSQEIQQ